MIKLVYSAQFRDPSGYGKAARDYLKSLDMYINRHPDELDIRLNVIRFDNQNALCEDEEKLIQKYEFQNKNHINEFINDRNYIFIGHHTPNSLINHESNQLFLKTAKQIINMTVWEATKIPLDWKTPNILTTINNFIVPCEWNLQIFGEEYKKKVYKLPHVIHDIDTQTITPTKVADKVFTILSVSQWVYRKGFDALIQAYLMEFHNHEDVILELKSYRSNTSIAEQNIIKNEIQMYRDKIVVSPNVPSNATIAFFPSLLTRSELDSLYNGCDLFALTSRGEGFGLPYTEAIMHSKPILALDKGGHIDFTDPSANYLATGSWEPCHTQKMFYTSQMEWYEPSIASIRKQLRMAYNDWQNGKIMERGKAAKQYILDNKFDYKSIGDKFVEILMEINNGNTEEI